MANSAQRRKFRRALEAALQAELKAREVEKVLNPDPDSTFAPHINWSQPQWQWEPVYNAWTIISTSNTTLPIKPYPNGV